MDDSGRLKNVAYHGLRTAADECRVTVDGEDLPARLDLLDHRPGDPGTRDQ